MAEQSLDQRLAELRSQRAALVTAIDEMRVARRLTFADDEHDPEGSTVSLDQARDAALLELTERTLTELEAAQQRVAEGRYGICEGCGGAIPQERLRARPEARYCVACSAAAAAGRTGISRRPPVVSVAGEGQGEGHDHD